MSSQSAFAIISTLSSETHQPEQASQAMHLYFTTSIKLTRRVQTTNLLTTLRKHQCGTDEVEKWSRICSGQISSQNRNNDRKLVNSAMKLKIEDAQWNARQMRREFMKAKSQYRKTVVGGSMVDVEFQRLLRHGTRSSWFERKAANQKKVKHLLQKWRTQTHPNDDKTRGVKYKDIDIDAEVCDKNDEVVQYGGVELNNNLKSVLSLNPKMMT